MLPTVRRRKAEPFRWAVRRLARAMAPAGAIRLGVVTGRIPAPSPRARPQQRGGRRIFTGHVTSPAALHDAGRPLVWLPYTQVPACSLALGAAELGLFLEGYVGGWIPDGWITLE